MPRGENRRVSEKTAICAHRGEKQTDQVQTIPLRNMPPKMLGNLLFAAGFASDGRWMAICSERVGRNRQVGLFFILRTDGSAGGEEQSIQKSRRVDAHEGDRSQHGTNMKPDESSCALLSRTLPGGWSSLSVTPLWACTARGSRDSCSAMLMRVRSMRWAAMR